MGRKMTSCSRRTIVEEEIFELREVTFRISLVYKRGKRFNHDRILGFRAWVGLH